MSLKGSGDQAGAGGVVLMLAESGVLQGLSCRCLMYFGSEAPSGWGIEQTSKINLAVIFFSPCLLSR